jgi:hypothetical protein
MGRPDVALAFWYLASLGAACFGFAAIAWQVLRRQQQAEVGTLRQEVPALALAQLCALAGLLPVLGTSWFGAGDAYHYALQAADFITQLRAGIFPVLVGQSVFGLNGNIHTLRTAPYYVHLCGLLDLLTWHQLTAFALQNLAAAVTALGGVTSALLAIRLLRPTPRWIAALLAAVYITAPGVAGPLLGRDMYAAFMTLPWLPLVVLASVQCVERHRVFGPLSLLTTALALTWYAHPPTAILFSPVPLLAGLFRLLRGPDRGRFLAASLCALAAFVLLVGYLIYSVRSMQLGYSGTDAAANAVKDVIAGLTKLWPGMWNRVTPDGNAATDLQPGWPILLLATIGVLVLGRGRWAAWLLAGLAILYLFSWTAFGFSERFWESLPPTLVSIIHPWPHQRMVPIFAAIVVVWSAISLPASWSGLRSVWIAVVVGLGLLVIWNISELRKFTQQRERPARFAPPAERPLASHSVQLTRSSYLLFGDYPRYFTHGTVEALAETRLLDSQFQPIVTNAAEILAKVPPEGDWSNLAFEHVFPLVPGKGAMLEFRFATDMPSGEIAISSGAMIRPYSLPVSGESWAFGSKPESAHFLLVDSHSLDGTSLKVTCTVAGASVRLRLFDEEKLPIRVDRLVPLELQVQAPRAGWLETPRVFIPGYRATVNGRPTPVRRSAEGLAMVAVESGASTLKIDYPGPPGLRLLYFLSLAGFLTCPWVVVLAYRTDRASPPPGRRLIKATLVSAALLTGSAYVVSPKPGDSGRTLHLVVDLPRAPKEINEPLLVLGAAGAADVVFIRYEQGRQIRIGYDHWGKGGPVSAPFVCGFGQRLEIDLTVPALAPDRASLPAAAAPVHFAVDGVTLLSDNLPWYPVATQAIVVGRNEIGASSCAPAFSGRIIESVRTNSLSPSSPSP